VSNALAISAVTETLYQLLLTAKGEVTSANVTLLPPDRAEKEAGLTANLFLYQVTTNTGWQPNELPTRDGNGRRVAQPFLALDLRYLLSVYPDDDDREAHHLLALAMSLLHDNPVLTRDQITTAMGASTSTAPDFTLADLDRQVELVKLTPEPLNLDDLSKLWSAFQTGLRLSTAYQASLVLIERPAPHRSGPPVRQADVYAFTYDRPRIDSVEPAFATAGAELTIRGSNLQRGTVKVKVSGVLVDPKAVAGSVGPDHVVVDLPAGLRGGGNTVAVVQDVDLPGSSEPHGLYESNPFRFTLVPTVTPPGGPVAPGGTLTVGIDPPVGARQQVTLFVGDTAIPVPPGTAPAGSVSVTLPPAIVAGTYLLRADVEGTQSRLGVDGQGRYNSPSVQVGP
jgi:hypothetical protein